MKVETRRPAVDLPKDLHTDCIGAPKFTPYGKLIQEVAKALNLPTVEEGELKWRLPAWDARPHGTICSEEQEDVMDMVGMGEVDFDIVVVVSLAEVENAEKVDKKEEDLLKRLL